jgi:hypothetical protein
VLRIGMLICVASLPFSAEAACDYIHDTPGAKVDYWRCLNEELSRLEGELADQGVVVDANTLDIVSNAASIAANAATTVSNATDIADNATAIAGNAVSIGDNALVIDSNTIDIDDNALDIGDNALDIGNNALDIGNNALDIGDNALDIGNNATDISNNALTIGDNFDAINTNSADLLALDSRVTNNEADIAAIEDHWRRTMDAAKGICYAGAHKVSPATTISVFMLKFDPALGLEARCNSAINPGWHACGVARGNHQSQDCSRDVFDAYTVFIDTARFEASRASYPSCNQNNAVVCCSSEC